MRRVLRILVWLPLVLLLLALAAYLLIDAWLDGAGGRRALEDALTERLGLPVHLQGEFNVMLLPSVGVAGTELVIGEPGAASEVARSRDYSVTLALRPLLDGTMVVESFALAHGKFYFERWPDTTTAPAGAGPVLLPEVQSLLIEDFLLPGGSGADLRLQAFEISDFVPELPAPFELSLEDYGRLEGEIRWLAADSGIELVADWSGILPGALRIAVHARLADSAGSVQAGWQFPPAGGQPGQPLALGFEYLQQPNGIRLERLRLQVGEQQIEGSGCLLPGEARSLNLELETPVLDLDALPDPAPLLELFGEREGAAAPAVTAGDRDPEPEWGLNVRLAAGEARGQGVLALEAWFRLGADPDCKSLQGETVQEGGQWEG